MITDTVSDSKIFCFINEAKQRIATFIFDTKPPNIYQVLVGRHTILPSILEVPGIPGALNHSCSKARKPGCQYVHIHQEFQVPKNGGIVSYPKISLAYMGVGFPLRKPYVQLI